MNSEDIDRLTLGELKAIAERAKETLEALAKVQGFFGAPNIQQATQPSVVPAKFASPNNLTPEQQKALEDWRNSPARTKLMEAVRKPDKEDLPAGMAALEAQ